MSRNDVWAAGRMVLSALLQLRQAAPPSQPGAGASDATEPSSEPALAGTASAGGSEEGAGKGDGSAKATRPWRLPQVGMEPYTTADIPALPSCYSQGLWDLLVGMMMCDPAKRLSAKYVGL